VLLKFDYCEHSEIKKHNFDDVELKKFNELFESKKSDEYTKYLGIHQEFDGFEVKLKTHYFIGYRWLDDKNYIHVSPKRYNENQADYLDMFLTCLEDPIVSKHLDETYKIFFNERWIDIQDKKDEITPFLILQFLQIVNKISKKGLKKGYIKVTENLTSKIKGKILINQTIKQNHFKNRPDKTVCNHQIFTIDCIENQILKTALLQCSRNLHGMKNEEITKLLKLNLNSFELVNSINISQSNFSKVQHSPFYKEYKQALQLAQMIFKRFGFSLNSNVNPTQNKIPPFYINMPELFERYVQVRLQKVYNSDLISGYGMGNGYKTTVGELRPDFTVKNKKLIIDAKYKYWFVNDSNKYFKDDFQQLSLYGRVKEIRDSIGVKENEEATLLFIYPTTDNEKEFIESSFDNENNFYNIKKFAINIPIKKEL